LGIFKNLDWESSRIWIGNLQESGLGIFKNLDWESSRIWIGNLQESGLGIWLMKETGGGLQ